MLRSSVVWVALVAVTATSAIECQSPQFSSRAKRQGVCEFQDQAGVYSCPGGCSCYYRPSNKSNIIDCRDAGLTELPEAIPIYAEAVYHELNLDGNQLEEFAVGSRKGYSRLTHLRLPHNRIHTFDSEGLPDDLHLIDLSHNRLERLSEDAVCFLTSGNELHSIFLSGNPFVCDCESIKLGIMLQGGFLQVKDGAKVVCPDGKQINGLQEKDVCKDGAKPHINPCYEEVNHGYGVQPSRGHNHNPNTQH